MPKHNHIRSQRLQSARRAAVVGIVVNSVLCIVKGAAGILGNSYVLVADAIESLTDVASSGIILLGLKVASRPPNANYPYGSGRAESLAALFVSMMLFAAAIVIAIESVHQIMTPHSLPAPFTLIVVAGVFLCKEILFRFVLNVGNDLGSTAVKADAWHHRSDALTSLAAFIGIAIALLCGPGYEAADDWAALLASSIILLNAYMIIRPALREVLDSTPDSIIGEKIRELATSVPGVLGTHKCYVRKLGLELFVDLDVIVDAEMTVRESHALAHQVQDIIRGGLPLISKVMIHVEPPKATADVDMQAADAKGV